jgi:NADH:ubiquinone oxidoreductase subunit 6 (subunit J)
MGMADPKFHLGITTPWILWSIILYVVALALTLFLVVPTMRRAAESLREGTASRYPQLAAGSGVASLLLLVVVILMVWKP